MNLASGALDRQTRRGWLLIGFALAGFFDGIVLHQILQWHHLLSGLADPRGSDLRFQIMADGLFHLLMYVLALTGAVLLVASRGRGSPAGTTTEILRPALTGFGIWHVLDAIIAHWILGLHRIKMPSETPLVWDIAWLLIFGAVPLILAAVMPNRGGPSRSAGVALMGTTLLAGLMSGIGPAFNDKAGTMIVFRADMEPAAMMDAVLAAGTQLKWADPTGTIWAVDEVSWAGLLTLHAHGALVVGATPILAGCLAWSEPRRS